MAGGGWQFYLGVLGQLQDSLRHEVDYPCLETEASEFRLQFGKYLPYLGLSYPPLYRELKCQAKTLIPFSLVFFFFFFFLYCLVLGRSAELLVSPDAQTSKPIYLRGNSRDPRLLQVQSAFSGLQPRSHWGREHSARSGGREGRGRWLCPGFCPLCHCP